MSQYGFVYILGNEYMPDLIKIGCTERAPRTRAEELSRGSGVPAPFKVLCYAEFDDFEAVERKMHEWCAKHRINNQREFFSNCLTWAVSLLWFHPDRLAFTDATAGNEWPTQSDLAQLVCDSALSQSYLDDLRNPWGNKEAEDARASDRMGQMERWSAEVREETEAEIKTRVAAALHAEGAADAATALLVATGDLPAPVEPAEPAEPAPFAPDLPWERDEQAVALRVVGGTET